MNGGETASPGERRAGAFISGLGLVSAVFTLLVLRDAGGRNNFLGNVPAFCLMIVLFGAGEQRSPAVAGHRAAYLLGMLVAAASLGFGVAAWAGIWPAIAALVLLGISRWLPRWRGDAAPNEEPAAASEQAPYVLLVGAVTAGAVALFTGYLPAARSLAYAFADLGTAFLLGALATLALWRRAGRLPGAPVAGALIVVAVALVSAVSFFGYPSLLVSGSAVLQTSAYLLTPGRVFPFYVLAFGLGIPAGLLWCGAGPRLGGKAVWLAPTLAVVAAGLLAQWTYAGPYALAVGLALAAAVAAWARGARGSVALRAVTVAAGALGLVWLAVGDPHIQWGGLRMTLGNILRRAGPSGEAAPAGRPVSARLTDEGWRVVLEDADVRATFLDGNLISFIRTGGTDQLATVRACVALGLAYAPAEGRVDVVQLVFGATTDTVTALAPWAWKPSARDEKKCALTLSGPGPLTAIGDPLSALSVGHLTDLRARLAGGGVLALWLPAGNLHVDDLRRALATVGAVFEHYDIYLEGRQAIVIAGDKLTISYARLAALFAQDGPARAMLADAGFAEPMDLLVGYIGNENDLAGLTDGVRPWSVWRPARPPAMALDLAEPDRPAAMLALAQYRMLGAGRLLDRLQFESPAQKMMALRGFGPIYANRTERTLGGLGLTGAQRQGELLQFLTGPLARLDLLAPQQKEQEVRIAVALSALGLRDVGAGVLRDAIKAGKDDFEVNVELAGILEAQADRAEALKHFRRAIALQPDSVPVRGRLVDLLLSMGQDAEAADVLKEIVQRQPDSVAALLELGYLSAKLKRYDEAADAAQRVLRIAPNNADAQGLLALSRPVAAGHAQPGGAGQAQPAAAGQAQPPTK